MGGITDQRHPTVEPCRCRVAVDHRVLPHLFGPADKRRNVEPVEIPLGEGRKEDRGIDDLIPAGIIPPLLGIEGQLGDPVLPLEASAGVGGADRVVDEPLLKVADQCKRRPGPNRWAESRSAPQHGATPHRVALVGKSLAASAGMETVGTDQERPVDPNGSA